jgi:hypothetical protein
VLTPGVGQIILPNYAEAALNTCLQVSFNTHASFCLIKSLAFATTYSTLFFIPSFVPSFPQRVVSHNLHKEWSVHLIYEDDNPLFAATDDCGDELNKVCGGEYVNESQVVNSNLNRTHPFFVLSLGRFNHDHALVVR